MNPRDVLLLLLTLTFCNCSNSGEQASLKEIALNSSDSENKSQPNIPADLDAKFGTFIEYFSKDSLFQVSRIDFPLRLKSLDQNKETETIIKKSDFRMLRFGDKSAKTREFDKYEETLKVTGDNAKIETRGVDNGIYIDTFFEKRNGKWRLVTSVDASD